ncbi:hypothetical protein C5O00_05905 [Pukyongia salina]|uniref:Uncharacterized protein n=1 Tax=Pukyongia salina TaxID=2094025 RepID=A0A2S0HVP0_9FLAO|nr:hypothetical protein [Pukyongia salina]AVI50729.1 hypothetical protein C5O00_05905 [Pukyongia salina]
MKNFLLIISMVTLSLCVSCGSSEENSIEDDLVVQDVNNQYGDTTVAFPKLSPEAEAEISNWSVFDDFQNEMNSLNGSTISEIRNKTERLKLFTDSLSKKIPETLATQPITSRLLVVRSRVYLLDQEAKKSRVDSLSIEEHLKELTSASINFYRQIDEKFHKARIDQEREDDEKKELEKQKRFLDSVYQAELRDQQN